MAVNFSRFPVSVIREFLISKDYEEDEVNDTKKLGLIGVIEGIPGLAEELDDYYPDTEKEEEEVVAQFSESELEEDNRVPEPVGLPGQPKKGSPEWNDFVIALFTKDEIVEIPQEKGNVIKGVKCDGLRRVAQLVFGEIVESGAVDVKVNYPDYTINKAQDQVKLKNPPFAWVQYSVAFQGRYGNLIRWGGCADVNANNTDAKFLPYALATAETRAEARALRKALGIKMLAAEEVSSIDTAATVESITNADWSEHEITDQQKAGINNTCRKLKISVYKLINCEFENGDFEKGKIFYTGKNIRNASLDVLTNKAAKNVMVLLNELQQNKREKDDSILES